MSTINQAPELKNKVTISWALLIGIVISAIAVTFFVTNFYLTTSTIESRMDKRYIRHGNAIKDLNERVKKLEE